MKVTKEALVARTMEGLSTVILNVGESCEEEQVISDVANMVQASLVHPTTESGETITVSQNEVHSVTSMLWSSEGILRQALLAPGIVNFTGSDDDDDEEKQPKDSSSVDIHVKNALPPVSELQRPGGLSMEVENENQLIAQTLEDRSTRRSSETLDTSLLNLHNAESLQRSLSQFPCAVELTSASQLLLGPLPPISEVHKAAACQLLVASDSTDQLLNSENRNKELETYQSSPSPPPTDVTGSLLLSSTRDPLPTISSRQISVLLSALGSDLSNSEIPVKDLTSLSEIEMTPRKLTDQLDISNSSKVLQIQINSNPKASILQTNMVDDAVPMTISINERKMAPPTKKTKSILKRNSKSIDSSSNVFRIELAKKNKQQATIIKVKQEHTPPKKSKSSEPNETEKKCSPDPIKAKMSLIERVACFKCSLCPFLSLDKDGVDTHIADEHTPECDASSQSSQSHSQELQCPGCPNIFFSVQSLQVHLRQDHRVNEQDVQQIIDFLCPVISVNIGDDMESMKPEEIDLQMKRINNKDSTSTDVEVYTDENGKVHIRSCVTSQPVDAYVEVPEMKQSAEPDTTLDTDNLDTAIFSEGGFDENSDSDGKVLPKSSSNTKQQSNVVKRRGRPRGSRNIGITALRKQNPSLRLGEKELGYRCAIDGCAVRLRSHDNIEYHRRCHSEGFLFNCPECSETFPQWRILTAHLWRAHLIDMELYACDQCDYKTNSYSKLMNLHKRIHGSERPFLCDTCGKGFKTNKQLRNHKVIHNTSAKALKLKSGKCDICCRHFSDKRLLRLHKDNVHKKLRPFLCNYCGYAASSRSTLKMHMRQHTGEKPFACSECEYKTADHNSLRRHRMRHSGQKKYQCPHCSYGCIQSSTYKTHLRNKHPGQDDGLLFSCPHCPFRTIKRDNHMAHLAEHQSGSIVAASLPQKKTAAKKSDGPAKRSKRNNTNKSNSKTVKKLDATTSTDKPTAAATEKTAVSKVKSSIKGKTAAASTDVTGKNTAVPSNKTTTAVTGKTAASSKSKTAAAVPGKPAIVSKGKTATASKNKISVALKNKTSSALKIKIAPASKDTTTAASKDTNTVVSNDTTSAASKGKTAVVPTNKTTATEPSKKTVVSTRRSTTASTEKTTSASANKPVSASTSKTVGCVAGGTRSSKAKAAGLKPVLAAIIKKKDQIFLKPKSKAKNARTLQTIDEEMEEKLIQLENAFNEKSTAKSLEFTLQLSQSKRSTKGNSMLTEKMEFTHTTSGNDMSAIGSMLQPSNSSSDASRSNAVSSQLKLAAQLEELGVQVPVLNVIDSNKLLQLSATDLVPLGLTAAQATALQLALASAEIKHIDETNPVTKKR